MHICSLSYYRSPFQGRYRCKQIHSRTFQSYTPLLTIIVFYQFLLLGQQVLAQNLHVPALPSAVAAGSSLVVYLQARNATLVAGVAPPAACSAGLADCSAVSTGGWAVFGSNLTWGSGAAPLLAATALATLSSGASQVVVGGLSDLGGGAYSAQFAVQRGASLLVSLRLGGVEVPGSPFSVSVLPAATVGAQSLAAGLGASVAMQGSVASFRLRACDAWGNYAQAGGEQRQVAVYAFASPPGDCNRAVDQASPSVLYGTPADNADGSYNVLYSAPAAPTFYLCVMFKGVAVANTPLRVAGLPSPDPSAASEVAVMALAAASLALLLAVAALTWLYRARPLFKASSPLFLQLMIAGCMIMVSAVFPLASQTAPACMLAPLLVSWGFLLMLSSLAVRSWPILQIFTKQAGGFSRSLVYTDGTLLLVVLVVMALDIIFSIAWWAADPLVPAQQQLSTNAAQSFFVCRGASGTWAWVSIGDKLALALYGVYLAVRLSSLKIQSNTFHESKALSAVFLNTAVWCVFVFLLVLYLYEQRTLVLWVEVLGILITALVNVAIMLASKVKFQQYACKIKSATFHSHAYLISAYTRTSKNNCRRPWRIRNGCSFNWDIETFFGKGLLV
jgi:hypothetical protein